MSQPVNPLTGQPIFSGDMPLPPTSFTVQDEASNIGGPRTLAERMFSPGTAETGAGASVQKLGRTHLRLVIGEFLKYVATRRDDVVLEEISDDTGTGWCVKILNRTATVRTPGQDAARIPGQDGA